MDSLVVSGGDSEGAGTGFLGQMCTCKNMDVVPNEVHVLAFVGDTRMLYRSRRKVFEQASAERDVDDLGATADSQDWDIAPNRLFREYEVELVLFTIDVIKGGSSSSPIPGRVYVSSAGKDKPGIGRELGPGIGEDNRFEAPEPDQVDHFLKKSVRPGNARITPGAFREPCRNSYHAATEIQ